MNDVLNSLSRLIRGELALARTEAAVAAQRASRGVGQLVVALILGVVAAHALAAAAVLGLMALGLAAGWSALIVGGVLALLALGYVQHGLSLLRFPRLSLFGRRSRWEARTSDEPILR